MEPVFMSQRDDRYFHQEPLEDYSFWQADPWFNHAQACSPILSHGLEKKYDPSSAQDTIPWMYPEPLVFASPAPGPEQAPTHFSTHVPSTPIQALPPNPRRSPAKRPLVKNEVVERPIMKRARTRNRSKSLSMSEKSSADDSSVKDRDDVDLERSRMASNKFRARKRSEIAQLETEEYNIEDANRHLRSIMESLKSEILSLKMQILQHANCNCTLIQEYISKEAVSFIQNLETKT
ncbi:hypothetical protein E4U24_004346 [Claviceps purpurea]|nr:hypothetical protein E4U28_000782 [Claviceps purpurea]KAG6139306.1 hypothetical protein E4U12_007518 [Claviceps purpurea]KAG6170040.1 hypothetical protein E4U51_001172 [Claviceps purpurea]KAG6245530.1 hypothetical protein E4U24_004346 [Claviceps purpurea]KAG6270606.1 hypothetical protein E4U47_003496 [Claviceps purpurea]